jgi:hypothetical protein
MVATATASLARYGNKKQEKEKYTNYVDVGF